MDPLTAVFCCKRCIPSHFSLSLSQSFLLWLEQEQEQESAVTDATNYYHQKKKRAMAFKAMKRANKGSAASNPPESERKFLGSSYTQVGKKRPGECGLTLSRFLVGMPGRASPVLGPVTRRCECWRDERFLGGGRVDGR